ncbi:MAG: DMT family transporter [Alphaproteobacteria bacterium]|jgi:drug/metabolite transporter (DMT)-like permease|nr:DMT family transporter [Alphaproteobacteria bacterium]
MLEATENRWMKLPPNVRGILWLVMGSLAFSINDLFVKSLGESMSPFQMAFFRYGIGFLIMAPVFLRMGTVGLKTSRPGIHGARLIIACIAQVGVYTAVVYLPLADATALAFSRILFTTIVAVIVLREVVSGGRWTATFAGFVGVIIMVRPGGDIDPIALVAIGGACTFAVANVMIRLMSTTEPPNRILFYYQAGGILVFLPPTVLLWQTPPDLVSWLMALAIGILTAVGMIGFIRGFAVGEASVIGPTEYIRLIFAAGFGLLIFGEVPDGWTITGALIIVACTSFIARMESRKRSVK